MWTEVTGKRSQRCVHLTNGVVYSGLEVQLKLIVPGSYVDCNLNLMCYRRRSGLDLFSFPQLNTASTSCFHYSHCRMSPETLWISVKKKLWYLCYLAGSKISTRSAVNASTTPAFFVNQFNNTSAPQSPVPLILSDFGLVFLCTFKYWKLQVSFSVLVSKR